MQDRLVTPVQACRACGGALGVSLCDLGEQPLANAYLDPAADAGAEPRFPLHVRVCATCRLAQLSHVVDAHRIFSDYAYLSSTSASWLAHAAAFSRAATARFGLGPDSLIVEIASNDGYLLRNFVDARIPCLGIEPAANVADIAIRAGIPTEIAFFDQSVARDVVRRRGHADLIVANNVLAHVPDVRDFVAGLATLAGDGGVLSIEVPHLLNLIREVQFDTIYHEHYAYWSLLALEALFAAHGLAVFDVEALATHGGSLRVFAAAAGMRAMAPSVAALRDIEHDAGLDRDETYRAFDARVDEVVYGFRAYLAAARAEGRTVAGYGAAAKGNTFLNRAGIAAHEIVAVADANMLKSGKLLPGTHIPVVEPAALLATAPDDIVVLPWNLRAEIGDQLRTAGFTGRLVTAIPALVVDAA